MDASDAFVLWKYNFSESPLKAPLKALLRERRYVRGNGAFFNGDRRRSLGEWLAQMRRKVARGATEWRDATQQLSVSCVSAVTEATAAARAEAEAITTTEAVGAAETSVAVASAALEDQSGVRDGGRGTTPVQIRHSRVNGRTAHIIYGTFINGA